MIEHQGRRVQPQQVEAKIKILAKRTSSTKMDEEIRTLWLREGRASLNDAQVQGGHSGAPRITTVRYEHQRKDREYLKMKKMCIGNLYATFQ